MEADVTAPGLASAASTTDREGERRDESFPRPVKTRWHPLRSGLLNLYRYDEEEFWFEHGRLLLRGNNGTGKSRVLALQLPFLLDGEVVPHRVEPDGDPAKRMEWNLLMDRHADRLGYTWVELGRLLPDGSESFVTLGCGLRAVRGRGLDDRWFFITNKRVGRDLFLVSEGRNPLGRDRLEQAVGRANVYRQARDYRRAVDDALFKLGARYEALLELLIRLRQPQLSRKLDEAALSRALSDALAPLPAALVEDTAEAFRGLEADRDDLAAVRATSEAVHDFLAQYRRYIRAAARRRADFVRTAHSAFEGAARRIREATQQRDAFAAACLQMKREIAANEDAQQALQAEIRVLEESPEMRDAQELDRARQEADRCEALRAQAERDAHAALSVEETARAEHAELCRHADAIEQQSREALAEVARRAEMAAFAEPHAAALLRADELVGDLDRIDGARRTLEPALQRRASAIAHLQRRQEDFVQAARLSLDRDRELATAANDLTAAREREHSVRRALERAAERLFSDFAAWRDRLKELVVADPASLAEEFRCWVDSGEGNGPLQLAAEAARQAAERSITQERTLAEVRAKELAERASEIEAEIRQLECGEHLPPPAPHTRTSPRAGRPGAPLWNLCDFRPEIPPEQRAGIEAAMEASGLLDAWVLPDAVLIDPETEDTLLLPPPDGAAPPPGAETRDALDLWLEPVRSDETASFGVSIETVHRVLSAIGAGKGKGEHWVASDGSWRLASLHGRWSKREAEHIGEASRAAARRRQIASLREQRAALELESERWRNVLDELAARSAAVARELAELPSDADIRQGWFSVVNAAEQVAAGVARLERAEEASHAARRARDQAQQLRDRDATDTGLTEWVDKLDELRDALARYREALSGLWPQLHRTADMTIQRQASAVRLQTAASDREERAARHREAELSAHAASSRYRTLESTVGASAHAIIARHSATRERLEAAKKAHRSLTEEERQLDLKRERADADIDRHAADHQRHAEERRDAIERLARFAAQRLLAEADPGLADLDGAGEWGPVRGVEAARRIEQVLADTPRDDATWRHHQETIQQHTATLRDQLIPRGHQPEESILEDVIVVRCPFQGGLCTMSELGSMLSEDLAARTRLLDEKEREVIENHLLGEVVLELQKLVLEAEKWLRATNEQLASRPTGTGMLLRFQWEPDPDGPDGIDSVRRQLLRTRDLWTPEERRGLAEFLQSRIRDARDHDEAGTWREILATALDYRAWHRFAIERNQDGQWRRLTRRTYGTGSGGEKALALTLPQFAAAAAHYQSADPAAPRLILLDEAFVGIDSEMRAKCMGLLESFDLDFVMTSEREWGCYPDLPGLGIYQLSSRAGIDAVVCTRWVWNGRQLQRAASAPARHGTPDGCASARATTLPSDSSSHEVST